MANESSSDPAAGLRMDDVELRKDHSNHVELGIDWLFPAACVDQKNVVQQTQYCLAQRAWLITNAQYLSALFAHKKYRFS
jgi:hypothetical protein